MSKIIAGGIFLLTLVALTYVNCGDSPLDRPTQLTSEKRGMGAVTPVLAVRSPACLMCHAKIKGDMVTDFGYGEPYFFALDRKENHIKDNDYGPFHSKHGNYIGAWETASIFGNVYVPNVNLTDARIIEAYTHPDTGNPSVASVPLTQFLVSNYMDPFAKAVKKFLKYETSKDPAVPGLRGKVIGRKTVYIGAPTEDEIRSLTFRPEARRKVVELGVAVYTGDSGDEIAGLIAKQNSVSMRFFITNKGTMRCKGDVIVDGTLFLNNSVIETDARGCRLYVSQSVFIQGPIKFKNSSPLGTLQISSSRAIILGTRALSSRLAEDATTFATQGMRGAVTDEQELAFNAKIFDDRDKVDGLTNDAGPYKIRRLVNRTASPRTVGDVIAVQEDFDDQEFRYLPGQREIPGNFCAWLWDPSNVPDAECVDSWANDYRRKSISYRNVLFNAPKVHSRYYGEISGVIIAEDALFAVGSFQFVFNPVFNKVPILPLVGKRILSVSEK